MMQIKSNFNNFIFYGVSVAAWQRARLPAAYAVVAGGCDWPLPPAVGLSNHDAINCIMCLASVPLVALRFLRFLRPLRQFRYGPCVPHVACVALDENPALCFVWCLNG